MGKQYFESNDGWKSPDQARKRHAYFENSGGRYRRCFRQNRFKRRRITGELFCSERNYCQINFMKNFRKTFYIFAAAFLLLALSAVAFAQSTRERTSFNENWRFQKDDPNGA